MEPDPRDGLAAAAAVETHGSWVLFTSDRAFKLLKPVTTPFFDYSTPALRRAACERELRLNRRLAPDVYLGVSPVLEDGVETDCMVVMRRLPDDRRLSTLVGSAEFLDRVRQVARVIGVFHAALPPDPDAARLSTRDAVADLWTRQNLDDLDQHHAVLLGAAQLAEIRKLATQFLAGREPLFAARIKAGRAVDGHGDLLADDIFCLDDGPRILDCLAFSDDLRRGDTAADLAFLAMDLEHLAGPEAVRALVDTYVEDTDDHLPWPLLHHWIAYRALVRAKVRAMRAAQGTSESCRRAATEAIEFRDQCLAHLRMAVVRLTLVGGAPGTGKTTLAAEISARTGAIVLSSDEVRKELLGVSRTDHTGAPLDQGMYGGDVSVRVYTELCRRAEELLGLGWSVVLDASWSSARMRTLARTVAGRAVAEVEEIRCVVAQELAEDRIRARLARGDDTSDATPQLAAALAARFEPWPEAGTMDRSGGAARRVSGVVHARNSSERVFPTIAARNLQRLDVTLPDAFEGERNVVMIAFARNHQGLVDSWVPWLEARVALDPGLRFYELPTIGRIWAPMRPFIDGGMAAAIREPVILKRTLTIYGDVDRVTAPLGITDRSTIALVLVDRSGAVRWTGSGGFDAEVADDLAHALGV